MENNAHAHTHRLCGCVATLKKSRWALKYEANIHVIINPESLSRRIAWKRDIFLFLLVITQHLAPTSHCDWLTWYTRRIYSTWCTPLQWFPKLVLQRSGVTLRVGDQSTSQVVKIKISLPDQAILGVAHQATILPLYAVLKVQVTFGVK